MRLQPTSQVADSEIGDRFSALCEQITTWVDNQTEDTDALEDRFDKIKTVEDLNMDPILGHYLNENHIRLIQDVPDALPMLVQYLIHCCLVQYVLGNEIFFYGLDIRNIGLLKEVEDGMKKLEPARGEQPKGFLRSNADSLRRSDPPTLAHRNPSWSLALRRILPRTHLARSNPRENPLLRHPTHAPGLRGTQVR